MATVLVVDDDEDICLILQRVLTRAGFQVLTAMDGVAALAIAVSTRVDAVLSDISMPRMNGLQLCTALRREPAVADVPVALLSGALLPGDEQAVRARACRAWSKPMSNHDLVAGLSDLISAGRHGHPSVSSSCRPAPVDHAPRLAATAH